MATVKIELGAPYHFVPEAFKTQVSDGRTRSKRAVTGKIVYINHKHRYFTVAYHAGGCQLRESFKF